MRYWLLCLTLPPKTNSCQYSPLFSWLWAFRSIPWLFPFPVAIARKQIVFLEELSGWLLCWEISGSHADFGLAWRNIHKEVREPVDHWVALALLVIIGVKMIIESFKDDGVKTFNR